MNTLRQHVASTTERRRASRSARDGELTVAINIVVSQPNTVGENSCTSASWNSNPTRRRKSKLKASSARFSSVSGFPKRERFRRWKEQSIHEFQHRALAGSVGAENGERFALAQPQVYPIERRLVSFVREGNVTEFKHRRSSRVGFGIPLHSHLPNQTARTAMQPMAVAQAQSALRVLKSFTVRGCPR